MKNKILVCGAGGFIGGHLVKYLLNEGYEVVCADKTIWLLISIFWRM